MSDAMYLSLEATRQSLMDVLAEIGERLPATDRGQPLSDLRVLAEYVCNQVKLHYSKSPQPAEMFKAGDRVVIADPLLPSIKEGTLMSKRPNGSWTVQVFFLPANSYQNMFFTEAQLRRFRAEAGVKEFREEAEVPVEYARDTAAKGVKTDRGEFLQDHTLVQLADMSPFEYRGVTLTLQATGLGWHVRMSDSSTAVTMSYASRAGVAEDIMRDIYEKAGQFKTTE